MNRILELMKVISKRPAMYVGSSKMRLVRSFLDGYARALSEIGDDSATTYSNFLWWVENKYQISDPGWGWDRILVHAAKTEKDGIKSLPSHFEEYLDDIKSKKFNPDPSQKSRLGKPKETPTDGYYD